MRRTYTSKNFSQRSIDTIVQAINIAEEYAADGYDLTLRQLYYQFVARGLIANKQSEYKRLGSIINDARLAGLMDWSHVVDRTRNLRANPHWGDPAEIVDAIAAQFRLDLWRDQPNYVEVWVEKEALAGVVERTASGLDVPWFACRGYVSQSELWRAARRIGARIRAGQPATVLHLGDHDPSGIDMTRDNLDRLYLFVIMDHAHAAADAGLFVWEDPPAEEELAFALVDEFGLADVHDLSPRVNRIALNYDQVLEHDPPPNPTKLTDSRAGAYLAEHGPDSWELDALPPDVLAGLITDHVEELRDFDTWIAGMEAQDSHRGLLREVSDRWPDVVAYLRPEGAMP